MERLNIYDENLTVCGTASRETVHRLGLLHKVVHCWVASYREDGADIYLQQRAFTKADFPGYYDLAVGGHLAAEESVIDGVLRESREEAGLVLKEQELVYLGQIVKRTVIPGFDDNEIAEIFLYETEEPEFHIGEEVRRMVRVPFEELCRQLEGTITAYALTGETVYIEKGKWVWYAEEFDKIVGPYIKAQLKKTPQAQQERGEG